MKKYMKSLAVFAAIVLVIMPCVLFSACSSDRDKDSSNNQSVGEYIYAVDGFTMDENEPDHVPEFGDVYELVAVKTNGPKQQVHLVLSPIWESFSDLTLYFGRENEEVEGIMVQIPVVCFYSYKAEHADIYHYTMTDNMVSLDVHDDDYFCYYFLKAEFVIKGKYLIGNFNHGGSGNKDDICTDVIFRFSGKEVEMAAA